MERLEGVLRMPRSRGGGGGCVCVSISWEGMTGSSGMRHAFQRGEGVPIRE